MTTKKNPAIGSSLEDFLKEEGIYDECQAPAALVGTWRRFGVSGPVYEIVRAGEKMPNGDLLMRVRVVESGEELDYSLANILDDPTK